MLNKSMMVSLREENINVGDSELRVSPQPSSVVLMHDHVTKHGCPK